MDVAEVTAGTWVMGVAALLERSVDDKRKAHPRIEVGIERDKESTFAF